MTDYRRFLKRAARQGTWPLLQRYVVYPKILSLPPRKLPESASHQIHVMVGQQHLTMLHWALRSFLHHCEVEVSLSVHDDGTCTKDALGTLSQSFPGLHIITRQQAAPEIAKILTKYPDMFEWWRNNFAGTKWLDFYCLGQSEQVIFLDPDVLLFDSPAELFDSTGSAIWMRDAYYTLHLEPNEISANFSGVVPPQLNSGLGRVPRAWFDVDVAYRVWLLIGSPEVQTRAKARGLPKVDDQPFHAVLTGMHRGATFLSDAYQVATEPGLHGVVAKHYVNPQRFAFFEEGIPRVARQLQIPLTRWLQERG